MSVATDGRQSARVQKQERRARSHERGRGAAGKSRAARWLSGQSLIAVQGLGLDAIRTHKWTILACSAMTGTNLFEGLQWVVQDAKSRLFLY